MALDFSTPFRRPGQLVALARWVLDEARISDESEFLEWKTDYDLSKVPGRLAAARQILGFANRNPDQAAAHAQGCAYLLIGVEPGNLVGTFEWDPADLDTWLTPYVGDDVGWRPDVVELDGHKILIVSVEAPQWGDVPHPLRREGEDLQGKTVRQGTIWVRKRGRTEVATAADIDALTARAQAGARRLSLTLIDPPDSLQTISAEGLSDAWRDKYLADVRQRLLATLPSGGGFASIVPGETRRPDGFRAEVESWYVEATRAWKNMVATEFVERKLCPLALTVQNEGDEVFKDVQVEVTCPFEGSWVYASPGDARQRLEPPQPPSAFGKELEELVPRATGASARATGTEIVSAGGSGEATRVRFKPLLVRPRTEHQLATLYLALPPAKAGQRFEVSWRATASRVSGEVCVGSGRLGFC